MFKRLSILLALAILALGSAASARTYFKANPAYHAYCGPVTQVTKIRLHQYNDAYYYRDPAVDRLVTESDKTGVGIAGKAVMETLKSLL